jgi:20S proteasome alpha/beta subunit
MFYFVSFVFFGHCSVLYEPHDETNNNNNSMAVAFKDGVVLGADS